MKKKDVVQVTERFNQSAQKIWEAITELDKMVLWYFDSIPEFKAVVGFKTQFNIKSGERNFLHLWEVTEVVPNQFIIYNWKYKDYVGNADVTFALSDEKDKTVLTVTCKVLESFDDSVPEFKIESCQTSWNYFIKERLKKYIESM